MRINHFSDFQPNIGLKRTMYNDQPIKILYIEDDVVTAARVQNRLDQHGYQVDLAMNGKEGLAKLENSSYAMVAVDYHLPGMNGLQVLRNLANSEPKMPTIMVTGAGDEQVAVEAMKLGVGDYLVKDTDSHYLERLPKVIQYELEKQKLIIEKTRIQNALRHRDTILEAVSFAAEKFLTCIHWVQPIQEVLARLGQGVGASRVYIFENHYDKADLLLTSQRYEWVARGITPQIDNPELQNRSYDPHFSRWATTLRQGKPIYGSMESFSTPEARILAKREILSLALIPIFVGNQWWGFVGYDDCLEEREWSTVVIEALKTAARILGAAIQHEQMDKALRDSEARLAQTQRIAHLGHCEWDITTNTRQLSEETLSILGLPPNHNPINNDAFIRAIHPADRKYIQKALQETIRHDQPYDVEFRIIRPDGTIRYLHALAEIIRDDNGKPIRFLGTSQDITERKQVEKALRESTQTLQAILYAATDSIIMTELDTTCVIINPAGTTRLGRTVDEVIGQRLCELVSPERAARQEAIVEQVIRTKQPGGFEDEEGENLWFEHNIYPVFDDLNLVSRLVIISRDISERRRAEEALCKERDFTNAIINTAGNLVVVLDRGGRIVRFNKTCKELTGYSFQDVQNRLVWELFCFPEERESVKNYFQDLVTAHPPLRNENYWVTKNNQRRLIDWFNTVLLNDNNEVDYVIATGIDITERKQAENALARTLAELQVILEHSLVGIAFLEEGWRLVRVNRKLEEIFGYTEEELRGCSSQILYPSSEDYENIGKESYILIEKGATYEKEHRMRRKDGTTFWCRFLVKAIDPKDLSKGYIWNLEDVTEQRRTEENLRLAATVFETTSEGIVVTDANNEIIMVNPAFTTMTGYTRKEVVGRNPKLLSSGYHNPKFYQEMWNNLVKKGRWQGEIWNRRKNGEIYVEWMSIVAINNSNNQIVQHVAVFSDITKRKQAEKLIWRQAHYDTLTSLPNRILFTKRLAQAIETAKTQQKLLAVMFIDLDRFKWVNDNLGHDVGDQLLKEVAQRLSASVRDSDLVARLGGDEFTAILPQTDGHLNIKIIAERILKSLSKSFILNSHEIFISGSIGITWFPKDGTDVETLLKNADTAMYQAKKQGRDAFHFFAS